MNINRLISFDRNNVYQSPYYLQGGSQSVHQFGINTPIIEEEIASPLLTAGFDSNNNNNGSSEITNEVVMHESSSKRTNTDYQSPFFGATKSNKVAEYEKMFQKQYFDNMILKKTGISNTQQAIYHDEEEISSITSNSPSPQQQTRVRNQGYGVGGGGDIDSQISQIMEAIGRFNTSSQHNTNSTTGGGGGAYEVQSIAQEEENACLKKISGEIGNMKSHYLKQEVSPRSCITSVAAGSQTVGRLQTSTSTATLPKQLNKTSSTRNTEQLKKFLTSTPKSAMTSSQSTKPPMQSSSPSHPHPSSNYLHLPPQRSSYKSPSTQAKLQQALQAYSAMLATQQAVRKSSATKKKRSPRVTPPKNTQQKQQQQQQRDSYFLEQDLIQRLFVNHQRQQELHEQKMQVKRQREMKEVRPKPSISPRSRDIAMSNQRYSLPIFSPQRYRHEVQSYLQKREEMERRKYNKQKEIEMLEDQQIEEAKSRLASHNSTPVKFKRDDFLRKYNNQVKVWEQNRTPKSPLQKQISEDNDDDIQSTFQPQINPRSKQLAKDMSRIEKRVKQLQADKRKKLEAMSQINQPTFTPTINKNSERIAYENRKMLMDTLKKPSQANLLTHYLSDKLIKVLSESNRKERPRSSTQRQGPSQSRASLLHKSVSQKIIKNHPKLASTCQIMQQTQRSSQSRPKHKFSPSSTKQESQKHKFHKKSTVDRDDTKMQPEALPSQDLYDDEVVNIEPMMIQEYSETNYQNNHAAENQYEGGSNYHGLAEEQQDPASSELSSALPSNYISQLQQNTQTLQNYLLHYLQDNSDHKGEEQQLQGATPPLRDSLGDQDFSLLKEYLKLKNQLDQDITAKNATTEKHEASSHHQHMTIQSSEEDAGNINNIMFDQQYAIDFAGTLGMDHQVEMVAMVPKQQNDQVADQIIQQMSSLASSSGGGDLVTSQQYQSSAQHTMNDSADTSQATEVKNCQISHLQSMHPKSISSLKSASDLLATGIGGRISILEEGDENQSQSEQSPVRSFSNNHHHQQQVSILSTSATVVGGTGAYQGALHHQRSGSKELIEAEQMINSIKHSIDLLAERASPPQQQRLSITNNNYGGRNIEVVAEEDEGEISRESHYLQVTKRRGAKDRNKVSQHSKDNAAEGEDQEEEEEEKVSHKEIKESWKQAVGGLQSQDGGRNKLFRMGQSYQLIKKTKNTAVSNKQGMELSKQGNTKQQVDQRNTMASNNNKTEIIESSTVTWGGAVGQTSQEELGGKLHRKSPTHQDVTNMSNLIQDNNRSSEGWQWPFKQIQSSSDISQPDSTQSTRKWAKIAKYVDSETCQQLLESKIQAAVNTQYQSQTATQVQHQEEIVKKLILSNSKQMQAGDQGGSLLSIPKDVIQEIEEYGLDTFQIIEEVIQQFQHVFSQSKKTAKGQLKTKARQQLKSAELQKYQSGSMFVTFNQRTVFKKN